MKNYGCPLIEVTKPILIKGNIFSTGEIDLLLGSLHLKDKSIEEIMEITTLLDSAYRVKNVAPFHCTGKKAINYFKKYIPHRLVKITSGDCFSFNTERSSWELVGKGR